MKKNFLDITALKEMLIVSAGRMDFVTGWTAHGASTALKGNNRFSLRKTDRIDGQKSA
jgi:hypothetical protein